MTILFVKFRFYLTEVPITLFLSLFPLLLQLLKNIIIKSRVTTSQD